MRKIWQILFNTGKSFYDDGGNPRAAALTYFTLMSIVPVLAVALGLARGFGFAKILEEVVKDQLSEQPEIAKYIIDFAYTLLEKTSSGVIAGIGLLLLLWSVYNILGNVEEALNTIWKIPSPRHWLRKITDYITAIIICPLFFVVSSSFTIYLKTHFNELSEITQGAGYVIEYIFIHLFPFLLTWLLFAFIYFFIPNRRIPLKYGLIGVLVAGTAYQLLQAFYITIQLKLSSFGAIYGSFAALPLFLIWLNLSWMIILAGAELAYQTEIAAWDHIPSHDEFQQTTTHRRVLALIVVYECIRVFCEGKDPLTIHRLSEKLGASKRNLDEVIKTLTKYKILSETSYESDRDIHFQPAKDIKTISMKNVTDVFPPLVNDNVYMYRNSLVHVFENFLNLYEKENTEQASNLMLYTIDEVKNQPAA